MSNDQAERISDEEIIDKIDRPGFAWENLTPAEQRNLIGSVREIIADISNQPSATEVLGMMLWLYRRLPREYARPAFIEQTINALAAATGAEIGGFMDERGPREYLVSKTC